MDSRSGGTGAGVGIVAIALGVIRSAAEHGKAAKSGFGFGDATAGRRRPNATHGPGIGCGAGVADLATWAQGELAVRATHPGSRGGMDAAGLAGGRRSLLLALRLAGGIRAGRVDGCGSVGAPVGLRGPYRCGSSECGRSARYRPAL